jgi:hypothetical protein
MTPARSPNASPRHRRGRHVNEFLDGQQPPTQRLGVFTASRHAAPTDETEHMVDMPHAAAALGLDIDELDTLDVFAAASIVRRRALDATDRLYQCRPRLRRVRRATGIAVDNAVVTSRLTDNILAVQIAETRLAAGLDRLESTTGRARAARRARSKFYPYGGRLVVPGATHEHLAQRLELAENTADALHTIARRNLRLLLRQIVQADLFATSLEEHLEHTLDHVAATAAAAAGAAPPPILRLLRTALPAGLRHEWWREICSLFAEATPTERRAARLSLIVTAPRTIWSTWALTRDPTPTRKAAPGRSNTADPPAGSGSDHPNP